MILYIEIIILFKVMQLYVPFVNTESFARPNNLNQMIYVFFIRLYKVENKFSIFLLHVCNNSVKSRVHPPLFSLSFYVTCIFMHILLILTVHMFYFTNLSNIRSNNSYSKYFASKLIYIQSEEKYK